MEITRSRAPSCTYGIFRAKRFEYLFETAYFERPFISVVLVPPSRVNVSTVEAVAPMGSHVIFSPSAVVVTFPRLAGDIGGGALPFVGLVLVYATYGSAK